MFYAITATPKRSLITGVFVPPEKLLHIGTRGFHDIRDGNNGYYSDSEKRCAQFTSLEGVSSTINVSTGINNSIAAILLSGDYVVNVHKCSVNLLDIDKPTAIVAAVELDKSTSNVPGVTCLKVIRCTEQNSSHKLSDDKVGTFENNYPTMNHFEAFDVTTEEWVPFVKYKGSFPVTIQIIGTDETNTKITDIETVSSKLLQDRGHHIQPNVLRELLRILNDENLLK